MIAVWDTETIKEEDGKGEYVLDRSGEYANRIGIVLERDYKRIYKYFTGKKAKKEAWEYIIKKGKSELKRGKILTVYAHNTPYDFYNIADLNDKNIRWFCETPVFIAGYYTTISRKMSKEKYKTWKIYAEKNRIYHQVEELGDEINVLMKKECVKFLDTMALMNVSLKEVGDIVGRKKMDMPSVIDINEETEAKIKEYCLNDCEICLDLIKLIKQEIKEEGIKVKHICTINQVAIAIIMNILRQCKGNENILCLNKNGKPTEITIKTKFKDEIHSAYRGGFVRTWKTGIIDKCNCLDVNSLYPYSAGIMDFPDLRTERKIWTPLNQFTQRELLDKIGITRCMVENVKDEYGTLLVRLNERRYVLGKGQICIGTWTNKELKEAVTNGHKIHEIDWSILYEKAEINPLKEVFERLYNKRFSGGEFKRDFFKRVMNRGIGKFAQRKAEQEIFIDSVEKIEEYEKMKVMVLAGIPKSTNLMYAKNIEWKMKKYYCPIIPTLITAEARIIMSKLYRKIPLENLVYTDTDNIIWEGGSWLKERFEIGDKLGALKIEKDKVTGEDLIGVKGVIYGSKSARFGNNIRLSGVTKKGLTIEDFDKGLVKGMKLDRDNRDRKGKFLVDIRDLKKQEEEFHKVEEKLKNQKVFIDMELTNSDVKPFLRTLKKVVDVNGETSS